MPLLSFPNSVKLRSLADHVNNQVQLSCKYSTGYFVCNSGINIFGKLSGKNVSTISVMIDESIFSFYVLNNGT